jgi:hypothetical protein
MANFQLFRADIGACPPAPLKIRKSVKNEHERQTLGEEIVGWIEANCRVPEGAVIGQRLQF